MQGIEIRRFEPSDARSIAEIEKECFSAPWSEQSILQTADSGHAVLLVAEKGDCVVGYGGMLVVFDDAEMLNLAVTAGARRQGVAYAVMNALIDEARKRGAARLLLEVRRTNRSAITLYEGLGFKQLSVRKSYYDDGEDALIFEMKL